MLGLSIIEALPIYAWGYIHQPSMKMSFNQYNEANDGFTKISKTENYPHFHFKVKFSLIVYVCF